MLVPSHPRPASITHSDHPRVLFVLKDYSTLLWPRRIWLQCFGTLRVLSTKKPKYVIFYSSLFYTMSLCRRMNLHYCQSLKTINPYDHNIEQISLRMGRGILYSLYWQIIESFFLLRAKVLLGSKFWAMKKLIYISAILWARLLLNCLF